MRNEQEKKNSKMSFLKPDDGFHGAWIFPDTKKINELSKLLEAFSGLSDTALLKVPRRGEAMQIMLTDFEGLVTCQLQYKFPAHFSWVTTPQAAEEVSVKILLDVLATTLKKIARAKHQCLVYLEHAQRMVLKEIQVKEGGNVKQWGKRQLQWEEIETHQIPLVEERARLYYTLSLPPLLTRLQTNQIPFLHMRMPMLELQRLITVHSICCGMSGGVGRLQVVAPPDRCRLEFVSIDPSGGRSTSRLFPTAVSSTLPLVTVPSESFELSILWTLLKKIQGVLHCLSEHLKVTLLPSKVGFYLRVEDETQSLQWMFAPLTEDEIKSYL